MISGTFLVNGKALLAQEDEMTFYDFVLAGTRVYVLEILETLLKMTIVNLDPTIWKLSTLLRIV